MLMGVGQEIMKRQEGGTPSERASGEGGEDGHTPCWTAPCIAYMMSAGSGPEAPGSGAGMGVAAKPLPGSALPISIGSATAVFHSTGMSTIASWPLGQDQVQECPPKTGRNKTTSHLFLSPVWWGGAQTAPCWVKQTLTPRLTGPLEHPAHWDRAQLSSR